MSSTERWQYSKRLQLDTKLGSSLAQASWRFSWCGQGVPFSFPLVQPNGSTTDNHKILLQFNLHKLYNLWKFICNSKNYFYTYWSIHYNWKNISTLIGVYTITEKLFLHLLERIIIYIVNIARHYFSGILWWNITQYIDRRLRCIVLHLFFISSANLIKKLK